MKKKVLIVKEMAGRGGAEIFVLNLIKKINKDKFDIYILSNANGKNSWHDILREQGCMILNYQSFGSTFKSYFKRKKYFVDLFKQYNFDVIHLNIVYDLLTCDLLKFAKIAGVKKIITHSHNTNNGANKYEKFIELLIKHIWLKCSNVRLACSDLAAKWIFGNQSYIFIPNSIDVDKFKYNIEIRSKIRTELNIENDFVIGQVGRMTNIKNQVFTIDVLNALVKINNKYKLILIGQGYDLTNVKNKIKEYNLENNVIIIEQTDKVYEYIQAMDCFVFPSKYEGIGIVVIEAQASGLPCIISENVPKEANVTDKETFLPITDADLWVNKILEISNSDYDRENNDNIERLKEKGFDIESLVKKMEEIYSE